MYTKIYKCMFCEADAGERHICPECRHAFLYYKSMYYTKKKLYETTELDEEMFGRLCKSMNLDEILNESIYGILPQSCNEAIIEITSCIKRAFGTDDWLNKQKGRMDAFIEYVNTYIRKYYEEHNTKEK